MLTPSDIRKKVEDDLIQRVNNILTRSRVRLYNFEKIVIHLDSEEEQQWVYNKLSEYCVSFSKLINTCDSHTHDTYCYNSDDDEELLDQKTLYCRHANGSCECPKYLVFVSMKKK
jgi:hypothetical protein